MKIIISNNDEFIDDIWDAYNIHLIMSQLYKKLEGVYTGSPHTHQIIGVTIYSKSILAFQIESIVRDTIIVKYIG